MEAGLDSLAVTQLIKVLNEKFDMYLSSVTIFDHPTTNNLSKHLFLKNRMANLKRFRYQLAALKKKRFLI